MLGRKIEGKKMRVEISEPTGSAIGGGRALVIPWLECLLHFPAIHFLASMLFYETTIIAQ